MRRQTLGCARGALGWLLFSIVGLTSVGCARGPDIESPQLPLKRVVVYRNGVGYFERGGLVEGEHVSFEMRQRMVGDFLATLAIVERGGSSLKSASFPLQLAEPNDAEPEPAVEAEGPYKNAPSAIAPQPPKPRRPPPEERLRRVELSLDGKRHDLTVGYVAATPVWRPSYRVVIGKADADLQVWGIVQNLSGEDWKNVGLTLVAGAPLAFESTLGEPVTPARPVVTDTGEIIAQVPTGLTSLADQPQEPAAAPPASLPAAELDAARDDAKEEGDYGMQFQGLRGIGGGGAATGNRLSSAAKPRASAKKAALPAAAPVALLESVGAVSTRRLSALAAVAVGNGTTRYDIPGTVTVPDESATMVLLASQKVAGESVFLFSPDSGVPDSAAHPFRVVRFTNATSGLLERGPIAVFERRQFLGQGMLEPLPSKATATVPFALDRSIAVTSNQETSGEGAQLFHIEASELIIGRERVTKTTYRIVNGGDEAAKLLVRHPRLPGARLVKPPVGTEDDVATAAALVPTEARAHARSELTVDEREPTRQSTDWLTPLADEAVRDYLADPRADRAFSDKLKAVWLLRDSLKRFTEQRDKLAGEQRELEKSARETRLSLEAIEKNQRAADLRATLTRRLGDITGRLDQLTKNLVEVGLKLSEAEIRFRDALGGLTFSTPLPPPG